MRFVAFAMAFGAFACLTAVGACTSKQEAPAIGCGQGEAVTLTGVSCDPLRPPELSCRVPEDAEGALRWDNDNTNQRSVDLFSWQQLIALSWPAAAGERGMPARDLPLAADGPRVWETWKEAFEVYLPDGHAPAEWHAPPELPAACAGRKLLVRDAKVSDVVDERLQALPTDATLEATLKDQAGRLVRYEIRMNRTLFEAIVARRLYDGREQASIEAVDFPIGSQLVKAAWRELDADEAGPFLATEACVCDAPPSGGVDPNCDLRLMGLVGWHLMTKTRSAPAWIWSTFEQVDNVVARHPGVRPLNDPTCPATRCPPNEQTAAGVPTQLARAVPIPHREPRCDRPDEAVDDLVTLNADVQRTLSAAGSVLASYQLVGTQWPARATTTTPHVPLGRPALLANTTMESFAQDTSSCIGCHAMARTLHPDRFVSADFSFTLNNALPRPQSARCADVEASLSCSEDQLGPPPEAPPAGEDPARWREVLHGHAVATRTYEMLGASGVVGNRLHCASCHLDAGGDPDASWWVDMDKAYPTAPGAPPEARYVALHKRINGCFERSMNGRALCTPGAACDRNPDMRGLIAWMEWLGRRFHATRPEAKPARGFPDQRSPEAALPGDPRRGQALFAQRCAFCHGRDGEGRYGHDTYFRPALWGPDSFNAAAGLGSTPLLTAFIRANMPLTSGGSLGWADARDLAAFIVGQCRPGKDVGPDGMRCQP